jgi:hypothetical protein
MSILIGAGLECELIMRTVCARTHRGFDLASMSTCSEPHWLASSAGSVHVQCSTNTALDRDQRERAKRTRIKWSAGMKISGQLVVAGRNGTDQNDCVSVLCYFGDQVHCMEDASDQSGDSTAMNPVSSEQQRKLDLHDILSSSMPSDLPRSCRISADTNGHRHTGPMLH